jgi:cell filamentation protein
MNPSEIGKQSPQDDREETEGRLTFWRIIELDQKPVRGSFDLAHLKEINRRIFQDLPGAGFPDVRPGEFRPPVPEGKDWYKNRGLSTVEGTFFVAYSRMDDQVVADMSAALANAAPEKLRGKRTDEFTAAIAELYVTLDHAHPFADGNSRTLRSFTKQLANEAGFTIDWERFNQSPAGRDILYIARDLSVNEISEAHLQSTETQRAVSSTMLRLGTNRSLPDLMRDAVRPTRAVDFEKMDEKSAISRHPELAPVYDTLRQASAYFLSKEPGDKAKRDQAFADTRLAIQKRLDIGETSGFGVGRSRVDRSIDPER